MGEAEEAVSSTWMPLAAGTLAIVSGIIGCIGGIVIAVVGGFVGGMLSLLGLGWLGGIGIAVGAIPVILGIVAIVGGASALRRKSWRLALGGSICALVAGILIINPLVVPLAVALAIAAIVFTILGKKHFK